MKILITTDLFRSTINGVVTSVRNLEKELKEQGHEVRILTLSDRGEAYREENVWYLPSVPAGIYPGVRLPVPGKRNYIRELTDWKPDVVHSQCEFCTFGYAKHIAGRSGAVLIHTCHTLYEQYMEYVPLGRHAGGLLAGFMRKRLKGVDAVIAPTEKVKHALEEYGLEGKIAVIPTGIHLEKFWNPSGEDFGEIRRRLHIPESAGIVLSLGRLGFEKNVGELLRGWKQANFTEKEAVLLIVGDGPARESLERQAEELGIGKGVRFYGMAEPYQVPAFYRLADVFVCASTSETQGLTYIEALASGLPLVCRKDPCLDGVLETGKNGSAYEDTEELVSFLGELLKNPRKRMEAGAYSRSLSRCFGTEVFGKRVQNLYHRTRIEKERKAYEGSVVFGKQVPAFTEWNWAGSGNAKRIP